MKVYGWVLFVPEQYRIHVIDGTQQTLNTSFSNIVFYSETMEDLPLQDSLASLLRWVYIPAALTSKPASTSINLHPPNLPSHQRRTHSQKTSTSHTTLQPTTLHPSTMPSRQEPFCRKCNKVVSQCRCLPTRAITLQDGSHLSGKGGKSSINQRGCSKTKRRYGAQ